MISITKTMATKTKEKKEPTFSERKNDQPPVTVKEDEEFKGSQQIVKIEKMDMPLAQSKRQRQCGSNIKT